MKARLAAKGIRVGKNRVLRLTRVTGLLAPVRWGHPGDRSHSGRIRTERPDELWGTDPSRFWMKAEGWCWFFAAVDHCTSDIVGWHVAKKGDRWAALVPVRQGGAGPHGRLRQGDRPGPRSAARMGLAVPGKAVPGRDQMARHPLHARLRGRAPGPREAQPEGGMMFEPSTCPENRMWTPPGGQARTLRRVGGSLVRYCRMFGLLMQPLLAAGPYGVREIRSKSEPRASEPSVFYWFF